MHYFSFILKILCKIFAGNKKALYLCCIKIINRLKIKIYNTMSVTQAQQQRLAELIAERMNEILTHKEAKSHYETFKNEADAQDWLMKTALVTLVVPISERQVQ